jgi:hypothetical protein
VLPFRSQALATTSTGRAAPSLVQGGTSMCAATAASPTMRWALVARQAKAKARARARRQWNHRGRNGPAGPSGPRIEGERGPRRSRGTPRSRALPPPLLSTPLAPWSDRGERSALPRQRRRALSSSLVGRSALAHSKPARPLLPLQAQAPSTSPNSSRERQALRPLYRS